jgi:hypothetical protein
VQRDHRTEGPGPLHHAAARRDEDLVDLAHHLAEPHADLGVRDALLVLLQEPHRGQPRADQLRVAGEQRLPGLPGLRLLLRPGDDLPDVGEVVLQRAGEDLLLGLEVVVERRLGHAEPVGDLAQGGLVVAALAEQLQRDRLDPLPCPALRHDTHRSLCVR